MNARMMAVAAAACATVWTGSAAAQAWIGAVVGNMVAQGNEAACLAGRAQSAEELAEARMPAIEATRRYWTAAHAADGADVSASFQPSGKSVWRLNGNERKGKGLSAVTDPIARRATSLDREPLSFVRSGDATDAGAVWSARDASGAVVGYYRAHYRRVAGAWKLSVLEVTDAAHQPAPATQFCHKPGDVEAYQAKLAEAEARRAAKKARKAARAAS